MTPVLLTSSLALGLVLAAVAGPWMLRRAAPALVRAPRLAVALLLGSVTAWSLALLALGPVLAWVVTGPTLLPGSSAQVCQRCLSAANPAAGPLLETVVPVLALLAVPALLVTVQAAASVAEALRRRGATRRTARRLGARSTVRRLHGRQVLVTDDPHPFALALPRRYGGVVISTGALEVLDPDEVAAVLAHEEAHLGQRHHLVTAVAASLTRRLEWVPLLAAAADALGHYLEVAADDAARRQVGTPALASALLVLGEHGHAHGAPAEGALHALGPERVRHLVQPRSGAAGVVATVLTSGSLAALAVLGLAVHAPYAQAVLAGCV